MPGCRLGAEPGEDGVVHVRFRVGVEEYPVVAGAATFVPGQQLRMDSAVLTDVTKVAKSALSGGGGIVVEFVEYATGWLR